MAKTVKDIIMEMKDKNMNPPEIKKGVLAMSVIHSLAHILKNDEKEGKKTQEIAEQTLKFLRSITDSNHCYALTFTAIEMAVCAWIYETMEGVSDPTTFFSDRIN